MTAWPGERAYPRLFSPFRLGRLSLANRFVVPALTTNYGTADGAVTDALCTYLAARARGGFGLVVTENLGVHASGRVMPRMLMVDDDRHVPGLGRLARAVKAEGAAVIAQLSHAGRQTKSRITGQALVAPSAIPCPINREVPRELSAGEIGDLVAAFVAGAVRVADAGFDGVEIHGAHGYLVGEFLSPYSNRRADRYGGSLENRLRFLLDIVDGIRGRLGADFPLLVRLSASEFVRRGLELPESIEIARQLAARGVHALSVSVGVYESFGRLSMVTGEPEGQWLPLAGVLRAATGLPTIGVGRLKRACVAEAALAGGQIDLAAFGRASIADPDLPRKIREGRETRVLGCMGCNVCLGRAARPETICPVNPAVGREAAFAPGRAARPLRLAIRGTSVSALTAAWVAARRGHRVTVHEPSPVVGGLQGLRGRVPGQEEVLETVRALRLRAEAAGVRVVHGEPRGGEHDVLWAVRRFVPVAALKPRTAAPLMTSYEVLESPARAHHAGRVVVLGDDLASAHAALLLAARGADVELRSPAGDIAFDAHPGFRDVARRALARLGARVVMHAGWPDALDDAALVVVGRDGRAVGDEPAAWERAGTADGWLDDAYEPGRLTTTVYDAAARATDLQRRADAPEGCADAPERRADAPERRADAPEETT